jgi:hypothetical protein
MPKTKAPAYQLRSSEPTPNMIVQLGARYARPLDDTTVLNVFHRTTDGGISVLLERDEFHTLAQWLAGQWPVPGGEEFFQEGPVRRGETGIPLAYREVRQTVGQFMIHDLQTTAILTKAGNTDRGRGMAVLVRWNGSGRTVSALLRDVQVTLFEEFVTDADTKGWVGWKSHA